MKKTLLIAISCGILCAIACNHSPIVVKPLADSLKTIDTTKKVVKVDTLIKIKKDSTKLPVKKVIKK